MTNRKKKALEQSIFSKIKSMVRYILAITLLLTIHQSVLGQNENLPLKLGTAVYVNNLNTHEKLYFTSEIHVDNLSNYYNEESLIDIKAYTKIFYDTIYSFMYYNCGVRNFIFEAPISFQYFFEKYIITGDSTWLNIIDQFEVVKYQLKCIRKLYQVKPDINVYCIDREFKSNAEPLIRVLFLLTFYEPFRNHEIENISLNKHVNYIYFDSIYRNKKLIDETLVPFATKLKNYEYRPRKRDFKDLYKELVAFDSNIELQNRYKLLLDSNYNYFLQLKQVYIDFYNNNEKHDVDFEDRELYMKNNLIRIITDNPKIANFGIFGYSHAIPSSTINKPLLNLLVEDTILINNILTGLIYYPQFDYMYPKNIFSVSDLAELKKQTINGLKIYKTQGIFDYLFYINTLN